MGIYISSDGTTKDTASLNSFNLVNGFVKAVNENAVSNVEALKAELLERLDDRKVHKITVPISEDEAQDLCIGEEFTWTFKTDRGAHVEVLLRQENDEDKEPSV